MTTIDEMDEFFDFDDAAHQVEPSYDFPLLASGPYHRDLALVEPENEEKALTCFQHLEGHSQEKQPPFDCSHPFQDTDMLTPDGFTTHDFADFPRWIEGMNVPFKPCDYCKRMRIHCKVIKEGNRLGSCTSCVALARSCSFNVTPQVPVEAVESPRYVGDDSIPPDVQIVEWNVFDTDEALVDWNDVMQSNSYWVPTKSPVEELVLDPNSFNNNPTTELVALRSPNENPKSGAAEDVPKLGARFSRETVRVLRSWLSTHHLHPYPTDGEKDSLRRQTGLSKVQITNWLANARRRGKVRAPRSTSPSPHVDNYANGMDIPRRGTPALQELNPLERWKASPPEHEPASVTAIAKAVISSTFSSGRDSPFTSYGHTEDGSARSLCNVSSTSSLGTSHSSGGSFASAFSHKSRGSFGSFNSFGNRGRRRRRRQDPKPVKVNDLTVAPRTFQCTFCTETFKTKHDWQRHEKSLHLSLERWICSPNGPYQHCDQSNHLACVYCGLPNPPEGHAEQHNHSGCAERALEERTFYRKDHLRQHLSLVHDAKFQAWSMDPWKASTPEIRSRCGFCGIIMDSWSIRVDHLAEHFKGGKSMADWKGDWGFEPQVLDIVENGMPPYLIHDERNTMRPFEASSDHAKYQKSLEDFVKIGLVDFINDHIVQGTRPTDDDLLEEGRKIILKVEATSKKPSDVENTWFRDLIMLSGKNPKIFESENLQKLAPAGFTDLSGSNRLEMISPPAPSDREKSEGLHCAKEKALVSFVQNRQALGLTPTDSELQVHACKILDEVEATSNFKCEGAVTWFKYLIVSGSHWLAEFRRRAGLPQSSDMANEQFRSTDNTMIDYSIHNFDRLENDLKDYVRTQLAAGITPTDSDLQRKSRLIIYKNDDPWNQTAADDPALLYLFKCQNGLAPSNDEGIELPILPEAFEFGNATLPSTTPSLRSLHWDLEHTDISGLPSPVTRNDLRDRPSVPDSAPASVPTNTPLHTLIQNQPSTNTNPTLPLRYFLNDANCYARLVKELNRFVVSCMSPNNPNQHVPSDAEIQNQARWVIYDDDDPWNQTAADNAEWLIRFKRDAGLAPSESGPGLPVTQKSWRVGMGGTGFSPPYLHPKEPPAPFTEDVAVKVDHKVFKIQAKTAGKFLQSMSERWQKPAAVFCSRDLEDGLGAYVKSVLAKGVVPTDDALRAKAREILDVNETAADEIQLLEKFKSLHGIEGSGSPLIDLSPSSINNSQDDISAAAGQMPDYSLPNFTDEVSMLAEFDMELGTMDLTTPFGAGTSAADDFGLGTDGGASLIGKDLAMDMDCTELSRQSSNQSPGNYGAGLDLGLSLGVGEVSMSQNRMNERAFDEYAELYGVHTATASPLRRKVSEKMALKVGRKADTRGNL